MAENNEIGVLTTRQEKALSALLTEGTIRKACETAGIPERTVYKWLKDATFQAEYRAARREAVQHATARLQQASTYAVAVLQDLMTRGNPPAVRLGAASKVLDLAIKAVELEDLDARLAALEQAYAEKH